MILTLTSAITGLPAQSPVQPPNVDLALNLKRQVNPFSLNNEADWVKVPRKVPIAPPPRRATTARQPNMLDQSAAGPNRQRMLPPAWDPRKPQSMTPAAPNDASQRSVSTGTHDDQSGLYPSAQRKPAPPKPEKPAALISPPLRTFDRLPPSNSVRNEQPQLSVSSLRLPERNQATTTLNHGIHTIQTTPTPIDVTTAQSSTDKLVRPHTVRESGPPLPPRRVTNESSQSSSVSLLDHGGLSNDDVVLASVWKPLEASRH